MSGRSALRNRAIVTVMPVRAVRGKPDGRRAPSEVGSTSTVTSHELKVTMSWTLRPISPADETALIAFHERCSEDTRYLRFAAAKPHLRRAEAHHLCGGDDHSRGALVVIESDDPSGIHGVGRWERVNCAEAELAFVVEDAHQGQGLGRKLVEATIARAHEEGFTRLVADVLRSNHRMQHLAREYGLAIAEL
jgi:GNAT superfamily N-acetyltransferase